MDGEAVGPMMWTCNAVDVDAVRDGLVGEAIESPRSRLSYTAIGEYAQRIADEHDVCDPDTGYVDVHSLLTKLGGQIEIDNGEESLTINGIGDFIVHIPAHTTRRRDRFTIAHELGHYFLHFRAPDEYLDGDRLLRATRMGSNVGETQANVFASNLLMPARAFTDALSQTGSIRDVARIFDVSVPAARVRADYLGLSSE